MTVKAVAPCSVGGELSCANGLVHAVLAWPKHCANTLPVDMSDLYAPFLREIPPGGRILDAGCGSGRDSRAFTRLGYEVVSIDASRQMVLAASKLTGQAAILKRFDEIEFEAEFDGIWACAS